MLIDNKMEFVSAQQMAKVDELATGKYGMKIEQLMENAGHNVADFVVGLEPEKIAVIYGKGNNGGGGLVAARHLLIKGFDVEIVGASDEEVLNETARLQLEILKKMGVEEKEKLSKDTDLVIDALLGYNINGEPRDRYAELIEMTNKHKAKVVALDLPSGVNPDTGEASQYVKSDYILTLALPKKGMKKRGNLYLVNIGIPKKIYEELGINVKNFHNLFKDRDVIKLWNRNGK